MQGDGSFETVEGNTYAAHSGVCGTGANHCGLHYHQKVGDSWPSADRTGNGRGGGEPSFIRPAYPSGTGVIEVPELSSGICPAGHAFENVRVGTYATREWDLGTNDFAAGTAQARVEALGIPVYRRLQKAAIPFCAGILYENDVDHSLARLLAQEVVAERPFSPIRPETLARALELMRACDTVINAGVPEAALATPIGELIDQARRLPGYRE